KLALSSPTGAVGTAGSELLKRYNLQNSVKLAYVEDISARLAALNAGSVDAIILSPPVKKVMDTGKVNQILDMRDTFHYLLVGIWAQKKYVQQNPKTVAAFDKAMDEAITWMKDPANEKAVYPYIQKATGFETEAEQKEAYDYEIARYPDNVDVDFSALKATS